jgi:hypothetical protein
MFEGFREYASIQCATGQYSTVSKACCWNPVIRQIEENSEKILKKDIHTVKCPVCRLHVFEFHLLTVPLIYKCYYYLKEGIVNPCYVEYL